MPHSASALLTDVKSLSFLRRPLSGSLPALIGAALLASSGLSCAPKSSVRPTDVAPSAAEADPADTGPLANLVILGTNDIHGALLPVSLKTREAEGIPSVSYEAGGMATFASQLSTLRDEYGSQLLWLDAGDEFQGTLESNLAQGAPMVQVFNYLGLGAAALGNHEFDFGVNALRDRLREAKYPYLSANFFKKEPSNATPDFDNLTRSKIFEAGALKIGVIGLATQETPTTTMPQNVKDFSFGDLKEAVLKESQSLRDRGAHAIILLGHVGIRCEFGRVSPGYKLRRISDPQGECESRDEAVRLLKSLPSGTVDAFVSGHSHTVIHHWVAGVPVIQSGSGLRYFSMIHLKVDLKNRRALPHRTVIEGPVPVCPAVFANQADCNGDRPAPAAGRGELVAPTFHDHKVREDRTTRELIAPAVKQAAESKKRVITTLGAPLDHVKRGESPLGNYIADALRASAKTDFAIINSGGIRASLEKGAVTYGDLFRVLPFENSVVKISLTGAQLKLLLRVAESGSRGFFPVSGLSLKLIHADSDAPSDDLDQDSEYDTWEINRLLDARDANARENNESASPNKAKPKRKQKNSDVGKIDDARTYTLATVDFLALGGDDWKWVMDKIGKAAITPTSVTVRDATEEYLKLATKPTWVQDGPRFSFDKTKGRSKGQRHRRSHGAKKRK